MEITRRTDYAIRTVLELAQRGEDAVASARELGEAQEIPHPFARSIITELVNAGLLASRRGAGGGVRLGRPAGEITLLEVVQAVEGPLSLNLCVSDPEYCNRADACFMHTVWGEAGEVLAGFLAAQNFADLARRTVHHSRPRRPPTGAGSHTTGSSSGPANPREQSPVR